MVILASAASLAPQAALALPVAPSPSAAPKAWRQAALLHDRLLLDGRAAIDPFTGNPLVVRCTGRTRSQARVACRYPSLQAMLASARPGDVLLAGGGASLDLAAMPREQGRPTLQLPAELTLASAGHGPVLSTDRGPVSLNQIFGTPIGGPSTLSNGVLSLGGRSRISGWLFINSSIVNRGAADLLIRRNTFKGSYTAHPSDPSMARRFGTIQVSADALPALQFGSLTRLEVSENSFSFPQVQTYRSQKGELDGEPKGRSDFVCNQNGINRSGLCLSANAIRVSDSGNTTISANTVEGALDEAFRINRPNGVLRIERNRITAMRMGPDSNIGTAIIVGQSRGDAEISIGENEFLANSQGVYPVVNEATLPNVEPVLMRTDGKGRLNNIDAIEFGLCRGRHNYPRAKDLYADPDFSGNCLRSSRSTIMVVSNRISFGPIAAGQIQQDGDGIDFNLGSNSVVNARIANNLIDELSGGDNGITLDIRGTTATAFVINSNSIRGQGKAAIDLGFANSNANLAAGVNSVFLTGNTFTADRTAVGIDLYRNSGEPRSSFFVIGAADNRHSVDASVVKTAAFGSGPYPLLYLNGCLQPPVSRLPSHSTLKGSAALCP